MFKNNEKRKAVFEEITECRPEEIWLENWNEKMEKDADKYMTDAEENKDMQLLATGNKLRKAAKVNIDPKSRKKA